MVETNHEDQSIVPMQDRSIGEYHGPQEQQNIAVAGDSYSNINHMEMTKYGGTEYVGCPIYNIIVMNPQKTDGTVECMSNVQNQEEIVENAQRLFSARALPEPQLSEEEIWEKIADLKSAALVYVNSSGADAEKKWKDKKSELYHLKINFNEILKKNFEHNNDDTFILIICWMVLEKNMSTENEEMRMKYYLEIFKGILQVLKKLMKNGEDIRGIVKKLFVPTFKNSVVNFLYDFANKFKSGFNIAAYCYHCVSELYKVLGETELVKKACNDCINIIKCSENHLNHCIYGKALHNMGLQYWKLEDSEKEKEYFENAKKAYQSATDWISEEDEKDCKTRIQNNLSVIEVNEMYTVSKFPESVAELKKMKNDMENFITKMQRLDPDIGVCAIKICIRRIREIVEKKPNKNQTFVEFIFNSVVPMMEDLSKLIYQINNAGKDFQVEMDSACWFNNGLTLSAVGYHEESIEALQKAIKKLDTKFGKNAPCYQIYGHCWNNIGVAYKSQKKFNECLESYKKAKEYYKKGNNWRDFFEKLTSIQLTTRNISSIEVDIVMKEYSEFSGNTDWANCKARLNSMYTDNSDPNYKVWTQQLLARKLKNVIEEFAKDGSPEIRTILSDKLLDMMKSIANEINQETNATVEVRVEMEAWCHFSIGLSYCALEEYSTMIESNEIALSKLEVALKDKAKTYLIYLHCLNNVGFAYEKLLNYCKAIEYYKRALSHHKSVVNWRSQTEKNRLEQLIKDNLRKCEVAEKLIASKKPKDESWFKSECLKILPLIPVDCDAPSQIVIYKERTDVLYELVSSICHDGDLAKDTAINYIVPAMKNSLNFIRQLENVDSDRRTEMETWCLFNIGRCYDDLEEFENMKQIYEEATKTMEKTKDYKSSELYAWCVNNLAWGFEMTMNFETARTKYEDAILLMEKNVKWANDGYMTDALLTPKMSLEILNGKKLSLDAKDENNFNSAIVHIQDTAVKWEKIDQTFSGLVSIVKEAKDIAKKMKENLPKDEFISLISSSSYSPLKCIEEMIKKIRKAQTSQNKKVNVVAEIKALLSICWVYKNINNFTKLLEVSQHMVKAMDKEFNGLCINYKIYGECLEYLAEAYKMNNDIINAKNRYERLLDFYSKCFWKSENERLASIETIENEIRNLNQFSGTVANVQPSKVKTTNMEIDAILMEQEIKCEDKEISDEFETIEIGGYKIIFPDNSLEDSEEFTFVLYSSLKEEGILHDKYLPVSDVLCIDPLEESEISFEEDVDFDTCNVCEIPQTIDASVTLLRYSESDSSWDEVEKIKRSGKYVKVIPRKVQARVFFNIAVMLGANSNKDCCVALYSNFPSMKKSVEIYMKQNKYKVVFEKMPQNVRIKSFDAVTLSVEVRELTASSFILDDENVNITDICAMPGCITKFFKFKSDGKPLSSKGIKCAFKIKDMKKNFTIK